MFVSTPPPPTSSLRLLPYHWLLTASPSHTTCPTFKTPSESIRFCPLYKILHVYFECVCGARGTGVLSAWMLVCRWSVWCPQRPKALGVKSQSMWAAMWVLSIKPGSPRRARNALKCSVHTVYDSSEYIPLAQLSGYIYLAKAFIFLILNPTSVTRRCFVNVLNHLVKLMKIFI